MGQLTTLLMTWIALHTGYSVPEPPIISMVGPAAIERIMPDYDSCSRRYLGAYAYGTFNIMLDVELVDPATVSGVGVLVHELVHYMQDVNGAYDGEPLDMEAEAYRVQALFYDEYGTASGATFQQVKGC